MLRSYSSLILLVSSLLSASEEEKVLAIAPEELDGGNPLALMPERGEDCQPEFYGEIENGMWSTRTECLPENGDFPAQETDAAAEAPAERSPMETESLEPRLARILQNYYRKTFSNLENWEKLQSIIFEGTLQLPEGQVRFTAYKKKPNFYKVVLRSLDGTRIVMAYDGHEAWQLNLGSGNSEPATMPEAEADNFIRDATIGGHLLDPWMEGKRIELEDIVKVNDRSCYELVVTMPDGQRIRSAIDILDFAERQQITLNNVNGQEERNIYSDFRVIDGVRFPFASRMESGGKEMHRVEMQKIRLNAGLIKSMFQRASESHSIKTQREDSEPGTMPSSPENSSAAVLFGAPRFGESNFGEPDPLESDPEKRK